MKKLQLLLLLHTSFLCGAAQQPPEEITFKATQIHVSASKGDYVEVQAALYDDVHATVTDQRRLTPLHYAVAAQRTPTRIMDLLLSNGADVNARDKNGVTPLHIAVALGKDRAARALLQRKANANIRDNNGLTPLHLATSISAFKKSDLEKLKIENQELTGATGKLAAMVPVLLAAAIVLDAAKLSTLGVDDLDGEFGIKTIKATLARITAVRMAVRHHMINVLVAFNADPDVQDNAGNTPLHNLVSGKRARSRRSGTIQAAKTLVTAGADPKVKNYAGLSAHDIVKMGRNNELKQVLKPASLVPAS